MDKKLDQSVQPVTFAVPIVQSGYYYPEASQAPAGGGLEGQTVLDVLGNQPSAALYPVSQDGEAGSTTETGDMEDLLDSSLETLLQTPKTLDTLSKFERRQPVVQQPYQEGSTSQGATVSTPENLGSKDKRRS